MVTTKIQNPAQFLSGTPEENLEHDCIQAVEIQTKARKDLWMKKIKDLEVREPQLDTKEQQLIAAEGGKLNSEGRWIMPDGRQAVNGALALRILSRLHGSTHWGTQALCDTFLRTYVCPGIFQLAKTVTRDCLMFKNKQEGDEEKYSRGKRIKNCRERVESPY